MKFFKSSLFVDTVVPIAVSLIAVAAVIFTGFGII